jgi:acyl-CoA thioester hydrolase
LSNPQPKPRPPAPKLDDYPHRVKDIIRYADLDPQGHVNNAVFATYFESGRVAMFRNPDLGIGVLNATYVLVRQEIDFLKELLWPGNVEIGTALLKSGRSSFTVLQTIFNDGHCAAAGRATLVMLDTETRKPRPLTPEALARLEPWKYRGSL